MIPLEIVKLVSIIRACARVEAALMPHTRPLGRSRGVLSSHTQVRPAAPPPPPPHVRKHVTPQPFVDTAGLVQLELSEQSPEPGFLGLSSVASMKGCDVIYARMHSPFSSVLEAFGRSEIQP